MNRASAGVALKFGSGFGQEMRAEIAVDKVGDRVSDLVPRTDSGFHVLRCVIDTPV